MEKMDKLSPQSPSSGPRSSLTARSRNRTLAILAAVAALGGTACGGEDPNNDQPDGGAGAGAVDGGTGGTGAGGTGGEAGSNPCEGVTFEGLGSKLYEPGETGSFTVEKDGPYKGMRFEMVNGEVVTEPTLVGLQQVIYDNYPIDFDQIGDLEATRVLALNGNQPVIEDENGVCNKFNFVSSLNETVLEDPAKQPILRSPNGHFISGFAVKDGGDPILADYSLEAQNTRIQISSLSTASGTVDYIMPNSKPVVTYSVTRDHDDHALLDITGTTDENDGSETTLEALGISSTGLTLEPVFGEIGKYRSTAPFLSPSFSLFTSGRNQSLMDDTTETQVNIADKPGIDNYVVDCSSTSGNCISDWPNPYPVNFTVSDAMNCTPSVQVVIGSGTPGTVQDMQLNGQDGSFTWLTGSTSGATIRVGIACTGPGGNDSAHEDKLQF